MRTGIGGIIALLQPGFNRLVGERTRSVMGRRRLLALTLRADVLHFVAQLLHLPFEQIYLSPLLRYDLVQFRERAFLMRETDFQIAKSRVVPTVHGLVRSLCVRNRLQARGCGLGSPRWSRSIEPS